MQPEDEQEQGRRVRPRLRRTLAFAVALGTGGAIAFAALPLVPAIRHAVGPATLTAKARAGEGRTTLSIPPLGTVSANTHGAPLAMNLSLAEVDVNAMSNLVSVRGRAALVAAVEDDLRGLAAALAIRSLLGATVLGGLFMAVLPRRRWRFVLAGAAGGALVLGAAIALTAADFDVGSFQEPRFTGALERAPVVIEALQDQELTLPQVQTRYETAAERLSGLLALLAEPDLDPRSETVAILHISDVHSNPIGVEIAQQLVQRFEVDAVLDTGDLTNFGIHLEANIGRLVDDIEVPYYFVPGNHDSLRVQQELDRLENVT
ncbi:MAG TPA: metallophosphoesterase family protein, partial [Actinomycetota bacterium]|nr:metallophosphoesterase family protein [Actinomycetota bacterium]